MSGVAMTWTGLRELKEALLHLPDELVGEATGILESHAQSVVAEIVGKYPTGPGNASKGFPPGVLKSRVHFVRRKGDTRWSATYQIRSDAPHASWIEWGTALRHTKRLGTRGAMRAQHIFVPALIRGRQGAYHDLRTMLERHGLLVIGNV